MAYIGKNIIENLTTAIYNNSRIVYREYIQNSADGIDKAVSAGILQPKDASIYIKIEPQIRNKQWTNSKNLSYKIKISSFFFEKFLRY